MSKVERGKYIHLEKWKKKYHKTQIPFDLDEELGEKNHTLGSKTLDIYEIFNHFLLIMFRSYFFYYGKSWKGTNIHLEMWKKHKTQIPLDLGE